MTRLQYLFAADAIKVELLGRDNSFSWAQAAPWLVALSALAFSIYQYFVNTRLKRMEYLERLAETIREEPLLRVATQILDWEVCTIEFDEKRYVYSLTMLEPALAIHSGGDASEDSWKRGFNETETLIREAFDGLFGFLENMQYAVNLGVITEDDVYEAPLAYYLRKLCEKDLWTHCAICKYLTEYGFPKTGQLLRNYRVRFAPKILQLSDAQIAALQKGEASQFRKEERIRARDLSSAPESTRGE
jgi:hypothetical protein